MLTNAIALNESVKWLPYSGPSQPSRSGTASLDHDRSPLGSGDGPQYVPTMSVVYCIIKSGIHVRYYCALKSTIVYSYPVICVIVSLKSKYHGKTYDDDI
jgi:hypothetical protein